MNFTEFASIIEKQPDGIVLLEGHRAISKKDARLATDLASRLAKQFKSLRFRSGNAEGSDQAFSEGIAKVDASRLQVVAPYSSRRKSFRYGGAIYDSPQALSPVQESEIACKTAKASPKNKRLIQKRGKQGPLAAKAAYLIRDTMKVTGHSVDFPKPVCALFFVNLDDPMAGGSGHTIRVCQMEGVAHAFQDSWQKWK